MKRTIILAAVLLSVVLGGFTVLAAPQTSSRTIADIREDVGYLLNQLHTIDNLCVVILGAQLNEELIDALHIRKLITVGKGNLNALIEDAILDYVANAEKTTYTAIHCLDLVGYFLAEIAALQAEIDALREDLDNPTFPNQLDNRKATKIVALLGSALFQGTLVATFLNAIGAFNAALAEVVATALDDDCTGVVPFGVTAADLQVQPQMTEKGPIPFTVLRDCKIFFGKVTSALRSTLSGLKQVPKFKKWVYKALKEVYWLLRATNFGGRGASELGLATGVVQVYTLNGVLLETQSGGLNTNRLPNGVYLTVTELRDAAGKLHHQVSKVSVSR